ncbi:MAG: metallophosphoesterase [Lachnospira sp.]|nr:metallophosphoesterase [Lachnospira sp.]
MQRIMIISDTHRKLGNLMSALSKEGDIDMLIHLGDFEGDEEAIEGMADCPVYFVPGNCDFGSRLPREQELDIAGRKVLITHGHNYYVSLDLATIKKEGIARGFDIVMFGHTHRPVIDIGDEITLINPGSLSFPRQSGFICTYIIMEIDDNNEVHYTLKEEAELNMSGL